MIEYLSGKIEELTPDHVVVHCGDIAYYVNISLMTFDHLRENGINKLYTHLSIKEDSHTLFGFMDKEERRIFRHLISVSGIGTNTARLILSSMTGNDVAQALASEDEDSFKRIKGIGLKTAKRIILDLKDKVGRSSLSTTPLVSGPSSDIRREAMSALISLGFTRAAILKTLNKVLKDKPQTKTTEDLIRMSLQAFSS